MSVKKDGLSTPCKKKLDQAIRKEHRFPNNTSSSELFGKISESIDLRQKVRGRKLENQFSVFIADSLSFNDRGKRLCNS